MKKLFFIFIAVALLSACGNRDAEYFTKHPEEMKQKMEECKKMSDAEKMADRECSAISQVNMKKTFNMDPPKTSPLEGSGKGSGFKKF